MELCRFIIEGTPVDLGPDRNRRYRARSLKLEGDDFTLEDATFEIARTLDYYGNIHDSDNRKNMDFRIELLFGKRIFFNILIAEYSAMVCYVINIPVYLKNYSLSEVLEIKNPKDCGVRTINSNGKKEWTIQVSKKEIEYSKYVQNIAFLNDKSNYDKWIPLGLEIFQDQMSVRLKSKSVLNKVESITSFVTELINIFYRYKGFENIPCVLGSGKVAVNIDIKTLILELESTKKHQKFEDYKEKVFCEIGIFKND